MPLLRTVWGEHERVRMIGAVLDSANGVSIIGGAGLRRLQQHFLESRVGYPYVKCRRWNGRPVTQQTYLLTATIMAPRISVEIRLAMTVLPGPDYVLFLSNTLREQVHINLTLGSRTRRRGRRIQGRWRQPPAEKAGLWRQPICTEWR